MYQEFEKASIFFYENGEMNYSKIAEGKNPVFFAKMVFTQSTQDIFVRVVPILFFRLYQNIFFSSLNLNQSQT